MAAVEVSADLDLEVTGPSGAVAHGHLTGAGDRLTFEIDNAGIFAGSGDAPMVRAVAQALAARGIAVRVVSNGVHLVTVGAVTAPWWQRRATGSRRIRVGSWRGAWTSLRSRAGSQGSVLPDAESLPPPTLLPLAPTFSRYPRRRVTTTQSPSGAGAPRLVLKRQDVWEGQRQPVFWLREDRTTVGSDPTCDIVLPDLAPVHAVIVHDASDEYLLTNVGPPVKVHGAVVLTSTMLRTGARVDLGGHSLSFFREEYADHGRPYGGRVGGEIGHQRRQPARSGTAGTPQVR